MFYSFSHLIEPSSLTCRTPNSVQARFVCSQMNLEPASTQMTANPARVAWFIYSSNLKLSHQLSLTWYSQ